MNLSDLPEKWGPGRSGLPAHDLRAALRWRLNRLRCMSAAEILQRLWRAFRLGMERLGIAGGPVVPPADLSAGTAPWIGAPALADVAQYRRDAERILDDRLDLFAMRDAHLGSPPRWNTDPKTGVEAPNRFGKLIDYRNPRIVGDIKYLWEVNRHRHLVTLAQAYALSADQRYARAIRNQLLSWFAACPYNRGPNWSSALEAAIRLINWSATWQILGGAGAAIFRAEDGTRLRRLWLESVYRHAEFIAGNLSAHSSANNHLIGEAAGLFVAALTWPHWPRAGHWLAVGQVVLEREAVLQIAPDGVNREQAFGYHRFVLGLLLQCMIAGRRHKRWFSAIYESRVEAMADFLASIMDSNGNVPMIGDSDDAAVGTLGHSEGGAQGRSLLAIAAVVFGREELRRKAGAVDDGVRWLVGDAADAPAGGAPCARAGLPSKRAFARGGYYVLGCDFESPREIRLIADAGPLGYRSIAAHGHADALAFTLSVGGQEFLIDPGTYAYHTHGQWRRYFRSTAAHNTVRVDGVEQSEMGGNFLWLKKANAGCDYWFESEAFDVFEGWHDGYRRLADPVMHHRRIVLDKTARRITLKDRLVMAGPHDVELIFHCDEHCAVETLSGGLVLRRGGQALTIRLPDTSGATVQIHYGGVSPMFGWVSRRFDEKGPTHTIVWRARLRGTVALVSEILC